MLLSGNEAVEVAILFLQRSCKHLIIGGGTGSAGALGTDSRHETVPRSAKSARCATFHRSECAAAPPSLARSSPTGRGPTGSATVRPRHTAARARPLRGGILGGNLP